MILVFNAGSSSLKAKLYSVSSGELRLVSERSINNIHSQNGMGHIDATRTILDGFKEYFPQITFIAHRIVMGGDDANDGEMANRSSLLRIKNNATFAPLHNLASLAVINTCKKKMNKAKNHLFYDTSFYKELPENDKRYPISHEIAKKYGIKKFGYHGISHRYAFEISGAHKYQRVMSIHLGAGCSITAIKNAKPIATSMGLTPLGGLIMQTRSGDMDPGVVLYLAKKIGLRKAQEILEKKSGLCGLTDTAGDMLTILFMGEEKVEDPNYNCGVEFTQKEKEKAKFALEVYCMRIQDYVGAYSLRMGGLDAVIFTGKVGAGSSIIRGRVLKDLEMYNIKEIYCVTPDEETAIAKMLVNLVINK